MKIMKKVIGAVTLFTIFFIYSCSCSAVDKREKEILSNYSDQRNEKYNDFLVDINSYTAAKGAEFQSKYRKLLIGLLGELIENKKIKIVKGSVGFYYDNKSNNLNRLFLGLDIESKKIYKGNYSSIVVSILRDNLRNIMKTVNSCRSLFYEDDIVGMVIGWTWVFNGRTEQINIWMRKSDVIQFEQNRLTFEELVTQSEITNTAGKVINISI